MRIAICQINTKVGDIYGNKKKIEELLKKFDGVADIIVFPELSLTGYFPRDMLISNNFIKKAERTGIEIAKNVKKSCLIFGCVRKEKELLFNSAFICYNGNLMFYDKKNIPEYNVFEEKRYFSNGKLDGIFNFGFKIGVSICEDMWIKDAVPLHQRDVDVLINISASPFWKGKLRNRIRIARKISKKVQKPFVYVNMIGANDEIVFDGYSFIVNKGNIMFLAPGFKEYYGIVDLTKKTGTIKIESEIEQLYNAIVLGTRDYFKKNGFKKAVIGVSGGIDSALCLKITIEALGKENVLPFFLPTRYTKKESFIAIDMIEKSMGIKIERIDIDDVFDICKRKWRIGNRKAIENLQARLRGMFLMEMANENNALVIACSNKSEVATGYFTLYGDSCGSIAPIADLLKSEVYKMVKYLNRRYTCIPNFIVKRKPSAELRDGQYDENEIGEYKLIDKNIKKLVEDRKDVNTSFIKIIHKSEFKRKQLPVIIKVKKVSFGIEWKMPITKSNIF